MYFVERTKGTNISKRYDYLLFFTVLILSIIGMVVLVSATRSMANGPDLVKKQIFGFVLGLAAAIIISVIDYKDFKTLGIVVYIISIGLLVIVLVKGTGKEQWGSNSWLNIGSFSFQPSELAKVAFIIMAAIFLERIGEGTDKTKNIIKLTIYSMIPIALILKQPDTGTAMVFMFIFFSMVFVCGLPYKYILISISTLLLSSPLLWFFALGTYQKQRIITFLFPGTDPKKSGYQVLVSKRAIGSGQILGKGLFSGLQTEKGSVPVRESDFIYTVIGEELGLVGGIIILILIFIILMRCLYIARNSRDLFGSFLVIGVTGMMAFHFFENIGMSIGILPVTGIPLPFISYGSSALVTNYMAVGIILSVSLRRKKAIFNSSE